MSVVTQSPVRDSATGTEVNSVPAVVSNPLHATGRIIALVGLLVVEVFIVTIRHWWVELTGDFHDASALVITLAITIAVFAGERLRRVGELIAAHTQSAFPWGRLLLQIAAYCGFVLFTRYVVSNGLHTSAIGGFWTATWTVAGLVVVALWGWTALPLRGWCELARRGWKDAILATAVVCIAWGVSRYTMRLWTSMADDTLRAAEIVLRLFFSDVTVDANERLLGANGFVAHIAPSCSGYEGIGLVAAVIGCYLWLCRETLRFPAAFLLFPLAVVLSWTLNAVRIATIIGIGASGWPVIAVNGAHTQAGWLAFNAIAIGVVLLSRSSSFFSRRDSSNALPATHRPNPAAPLLLPLLVIVGAAMITSALSSGGLDRLYAVRVAVAALILWTYRKHYAALDWSWSWVAATIGVVVFGIWIGLEALSPPEPADATHNPFSLPILERELWLVCRVIGAVILVPIAEELAFRGYLLRRLQGAELDENMTGRWNWIAVVVSSVLFGLLHPGRWIAGTLAGVLFAWVFYRRGRLSDAILAHAITNAILAGYVLTTERWELW